MHPFVAEETKSAAQKGKYFDPAAHNQPASKHVSYDGSLESSLNDNKAVVTKVAPASTGGSLDQAAIVPPSTKAMDKEGSVANPVVEKKAAVKPVVKPAEKGSTGE
jgi:hypothetical protein